MKRLILNKTTALALITISLFASSCGSSENKKVTTEEVTQADTTKKEEGIAEVTTDQMKAVNIEIGTIEQQNLTSVVKASGQLTVPPQNKAVVNALVGGVIRRITVAEGEQVKKGRVVITVNTGKTDPPSPFQIDPLKTDFKKVLKKAC